MHFTNFSKNVTQTGLFSYNIKLNLILDDSYNDIIQSQKVTYCWDLLMNSCRFDFLKTCWFDTNSTKTAACKPLVSCREISSFKNLLTDGNLFLTLFYLVIDNILCVHKIGRCLMSFYWVRGILSVISRQNLPAIFWRQNLRRSYVDSGDALANMLYRSYVRTWTRYIYFSSYLSGKFNFIILNVWN